MKSFLFNGVKKKIASVFHCYKLTFIVGLIIGIIIMAILFV